MLDNTDYYILCILELKPKYNSSTPFSVKQLSYDSDLDKSRVSTTLKKLRELKIITLIAKKPLLYTFNVDKFKKWQN